MKRKLIVALFILFLTVYPSTTYGSERSSCVPAEVMAEFSPQRIYGEDTSQLIWGQITVDSFRNYVRTLTENGSRWIQYPDLMSWQNQAAREYIIEELNRVSNGRIETEIVGEWQSVVGRLPGYLPVDAPAFLVGGHYDSVPSAPGANDDGTGVATMLEIARVMSQFSWPLDIYFGAWNAEEIGLLGSLEAAQQFQSRGIELLAHYNVDMLLVPDPERPSFLMVYPIGQYHEGRYWAEITKMMSMNYGRNMSIPVMSSDFSAWQRSDHWSFIQRGFQTSLFAHESGFAYDTAYHSSQDVWYNELYDYSVATEAVRAIGSAIAFTMSRAYEKLIQLDFRFTLTPDNLRTYSIAISMPTTLKVDCRWFGGGADFRIVNPESVTVASFTTEESSAWEKTAVFTQEVNERGLYLLEILNSGGTSVGYDLSISYDSDIDGNGVPDSQEFWFDQSYFSSDLDNDTISDGEEMILGTSMNSADSDMDSLPDPWEIANNLDPLDPRDALLDYDEDGLTNKQEYEHGCDPWSSDTDSDGMPDLWEVANGLDPLVDDADEDPDGDGYTNLEEYLMGTNPNYAELRLGQLIGPISAAGVVLVLGTLLAVRKRKSERF